MDFNYWLLAVDESLPDDKPNGHVRAFSSYSAAMSEARVVKRQYPSWRVAVEVLPAGAAHPDLGPYHEYAG